MRSEDETNSKGERIEDSVAEIKNKLTKCVVGRKEIRPRLMSVRGEIEGFVRGGHGPDGIKG